MSKKESPKIPHRLSADLRNTLAVAPKAQAAWNTLTPLSQNEWICWIESVKKTETRQEHMERMLTDLAKGKRRPCCWMGCTHRTDKPMSASQKWVLSRQSKKKR